MKIRTLTPENYGKVSALLRQVFPGSTYELQLVENFHKNGKAVHEWVCIHTNMIIVVGTLTIFAVGTVVAKFTSRNSPTK